MTSFERPCSGFTAADLISLQAIWPEAMHVRDAEGDRFVVRRREEGDPWLAILRRPDGAYVSLDLSGRVFAEGRSLAELALDGAEPRAAARAVLMTAVTRRIEWRRR